MLGELQRHLADLNGTGAPHDVRDFLITDRALALALGGDAMIASTDETVLALEDEDGLALSVFLDQAMLDRLRSGDPMNSLQSEQLDDLWTVLEGLSHFNYLAWSASHDRPVTLLELEMQAEVDKYVAMHQIVKKQGAVEILSQLHERLFGHAAFRTELKQAELERYRAANDYAGRFCHRLRAALDDSEEAAIDELRKFYRLSQQGKISHIHSRVFSRH